MHTVTVRRATGQLLNAEQEFGGTKTNSKRLHKYAGTTNRAVEAWAYQIDSRNHCFRNCVESASCQAKTAPIGDTRRHLQENMDDME